ncbi:hypothetical protein JK636_12800 [Clostridium sp. YIM B02515]|uniref:Integral membrane protein n=1 Tax=Clostridium rhizosphaerae TaxID=2803861 RepID=A0ABS1TCX4_9CLOT|nr:hypothetical protein [Clostridium rhizosphaerae]MBL4936637.1 hypothetical protein [Clostridium rhizosphaerae]
MSEIILSVFKISIIEIFYLTGLILIAGLILGLFERVSNNLMQRSLGRKGIFITAWLGTPIHELGHAAMCIIFNHNITRIKLLNTKSENGVLGYVEHSYNPSSLYQRIGNLFIGLGPIFSGIGALIAGMYFLVPRSFKVFKVFVLEGINNDKIDVNLAGSLFKASGVLIKSIFNISNLSSINFWIFIITAVCISSHIALSKADIKGAKDGFIVLFVFIFIINFLLRYFSISTAHFIIQLGRYNAHLISVLLIAIIFSGFTLAISFIFYVSFSVKNRRYI